MFLQLINYTCIEVLIIFGRMWRVHTPPSGLPDTTPYALESNPFNHRVKT